MKDSQHFHFKTRLNLSTIQKLTNSSHNKLSNAVCIQNLVKKNNLCSPSRLQAMEKLDKPGKTSYSLKIAKFKKQIEPHQTKVSNSFVGKSKSSLLNDKVPQLRQSKHRSNIVAIWQNKKMSRQRKLSNYQMSPQTASFYLKKGDKALHYELKMEIKKVQSSLKPIQTNKKFSKSRYRNRNFPSNYENLMSRQSPNRQCIQQSLDLMQNTNDVDLNLGNATQNLAEVNKLQANRLRLIRSTLVTYSSKAKIKKLKQLQSDPPQVYNIRNIVNSNQGLKTTEDSLQFLQPFDFLQCDNELCQTQPTQKSANCISVYLCNFRNRTITPIISKQENKRVEVASLTKIMTCFLIIKIANFFNLNIKVEKALVSERASKMIGTTASLNYSDVLTIYQLLHALMLPSGNDAAVALAEWGGKTIRKYFSIAQKYVGPKTVDTKSMNFLYDYAVQKKSYQKLFIYHMNKAANILKLKNTRFANVHGLMNEKAFSTSSDISKLTVIAMRNQIFAEIVGKKQFSCRIFNRTYSQYSNVVWKNTNKLLQNEGFLGVKTGVTPSAGPCLSSAFKLNDDEMVVIVVLRVRTLEMRFKQSFELLKQSLSLIDSQNLKYLIKRLGEDSQQTACSQENDKAEEANLIAQSKQVSSDQQYEEEDQDYQ